MTEIEFGYGKTKINFEIDDNNLIDILYPTKGDIQCNNSVKNALESPIGTSPFGEIFCAGMSVAIIISDITRPCPSWLILPDVIEALNLVGVRDEDIIIVCGLGSHRKQTDEERMHLVGDDIYRRIKVVDSDVDDFVFVGTSSKGTCFEVFRPVVEADKRICIGNLDYHYFAGYSGGCKAIVPGVCTRKTIENNHKMMLMEGARTGNALNNPVRDDMEEIRDYLSVDFIVNVILDEKKQIIAALGGDAILAHREGCALLDSIYKRRICKLADIVIASPGGMPKDINVYQSQKALDNAQWAVKDDGIIILLAECKEGYGEAVFEQWLNEAEYPKSLIERIKKEFRLGGHKAAAIAKIIEKKDVFLVSSLPEKLVSKLYMTSFACLEDAYAEAIKRKGDNASVYCMPLAGTTLPLYDSSDE